MTDRSAGGYAAVTLACLLWGFSFYFGKIALRELPSTHVVLLRFALASAVFLPVFLLRRGRIRRAHWGLLLASALLMAPVAFLLQFEGLARTSATHAALIIGAFPPLQAIGATLVHGERPGPSGWAAVALSTLGVVVMVGRQAAGGDALGDAMVLASILCSVAWVLVTQRLLRRYPSTVVTSAQTALSTLLLVAPVLWLDGPPPLALRPETWGALVGLGLCCTIGAYSLWNWGLRFIPTSHGGVLINLEPVVGVALGVALLGEALPLRTAAGGALILAAALLVAVGARRRAPAPLPEAA